MAATDFLTAIKDRNAWLSQHLSLTVAGLKVPVRPLEYTITEAMNDLFELDILIYSDDQTLDGVHFLGKNVSFVVEERAALKYLDTASRHARTLHGVVREFTHQSSSNDGAQFRLKIALRVSLLDLTKTSNVFLQKTLKDIFYELLVDREHLFPHDIELNFEGVDQRYDQLLMHEESVLEFFRRQCLRHGLYWYFRHAPLESKTHRDTLVVDNRANGYMRSIDVPYVRPNGLDGEFHEALLSIKRRQTLLPESVELRDHNYRTPNAPVSAIAYVDRGDKTLHGQIDRSSEHFHTPEEAQALTKVRAQDIASKQVIHTGTTNIAGLYPGWSADDHQPQVAESALWSGDRQAQDDGFALQAGSERIRSHACGQDMAARVRPRARLEMDERLDHRDDRIERRGQPLCGFRRAWPVSGQVSLPSWRGQVGIEQHAAAADDAVGLARRRVSCALATRNGSQNFLHKF